MNGAHVTSSSSERVTQIEAGSVQQAGNAENAT